MEIALHTAKGPILAQLYRIQSYVSGLWFSRGLGVAPSTMVNFLCKSEGLAPSPSNSGGKEKLSEEAQPNFSKQSRSLADRTVLYNKVPYPMHTWHCDMLEKPVLFPTCYTPFFALPPATPLSVPYHLHAQFTQLVPGVVATHSCQSPLSSSWGTTWHKQRPERVSQPAEGSRKQQGRWWGPTVKHTETFMPALVMTQQMQGSVEVERSPSARGRKEEKGIRLLPTSENTSMLTLTVFSCVFISVGSS